MQVGTTKEQGFYIKPSAAVHVGALAAGTLPQYNTISYLTFLSNSKKFMDNLQAKVSFWPPIQFLSDVNDMSLSVTERTPGIKHVHFFVSYCEGATVGRYNSVGIATCFGLDGPGD